MDGCDYAAIERQAEHPETDFIRLPPDGLAYLGTLESGAGEDFEPYDEDEPDWESIGAERPQWFVEWEEREAERQAAKALAAPTARPEPVEPKATGGQGPLSAPDPSPNRSPEPVEGPQAKRPCKPRTPAEARRDQGRRR